MRKHFGRIAVVAIGAAAAAVLTSGVATAAPSATCGGKTVTIFGEGGYIWGTEGDDVILGTAGYDEIYAGGGNDVVCALGGDDHVQGDEGSDTIYAGAGNDNLLLVDRTDDFADGGSGHDTATVDWDPQDTTVNVEERY